MSEPLKVHLGCGRRYLRGYEHVDLDPMPFVKYVHDIRTLPMYADNTVAEIYCCGAMVYFDRQEVVPVLQEWMRVLAYDGLLRLSVPDFDSIVSIYRRYGLEHAGVLGPLFGKWKRSDGVTMYQRTTYNAVSLRALLESLGFVNITTWDCQKVLPEGYDDYSKAYIPPYNKTGIQVSLNMEAVKP